MDEQKAVPEIPEDLQPFYGNEHYGSFSDVLGDWDTTTAITLDTLIERIATLEAKIKNQTYLLQLAKEQYERDQAENDALKSTIASLSVAKDIDQAHPARKDGE